MSVEYYQLELTGNSVDVQAIKDKQKQAKAAGWKNSSQHRAQAKEFFTCFVVSLDTKYLPNVEK